MIMTMTNKIAAALVFALATTAGAAGDDFTLNSATLSTVKSKAPAVAARKPAATAAKSAAPVRTAQASALDLSIRLSFATLNERLAALMSSPVRVIDRAQPVLSPAGDTILLRNLLVDVGGISVQPTVRVKPSFIADNHLALKITKVDVELSMSPDKAAGAQPILDKNEIMALVMSQLTATMQDSIDAAFVQNKVPLKAKDVLSFSYEKATWTQHVLISPAFISPLMPKLISSLNLTSFMFDKDGLTLSVRAGSKAQNATNSIPGCNLAINDALVNAFVKQFAGSSDFDLAPEGHAGGVGFLANGRMTISGKVRLSAMPLEPSAYFTAVMLPTLTGPNTITVHLESIDVEAVGALPVPGVFNRLLQDTMITSSVETITTNQDLARYMTAQKVDNSTVEMKLKPDTFLPSFASGITIRNMKIGEGMMYLSFVM